MDSCSPALLHNRDYAERSGEVIVGAGGEEQLVDGAILASAVAKFKSPELVDADFSAFGVFQFADIFPGYGVEGVNASEVGVVADDQGVAELAEILGSDSQAPGLVQRRTLGQALQHGSVFGENVDETALSAIGIGEGDVYQAAEILDAEGSVAGGERGVGERFHQGKLAVEHVDFIVGIIRRVNKIPRRFGGDGQAGIDRAVLGDRDDGRIRIYAGIPAADGAVERGEKKNRGRAFDFEIL